MTRVQTITITYHHEGLYWWADSTDLPGFTAGGDTLHEARQLAKEGVSFYLNDTQDLDIREEMTGGIQVIDVKGATSSSFVWFSPAGLAGGDVEFRPLGAQSVTMEVSA